MDEEGKRTHVQNLNLNTILEGSPIPFFFKGELGNSTHNRGCSRGRGDLQRQVQLRDQSGLQVSERSLWEFALNGISQA